MNWLTTVPPQNRVLGAASSLPRTPRWQQSEVGKWARESSGKVGKGIKWESGQGSEVAKWAGESNGKVGREVKCENGQESKVGKWAGE